MPFTVVKRNLSKTPASDITPPPNAVIEAPAESEKLATQMLPDTFAMVTTPDNAADADEDPELFNPNPVDMFVDPPAPALMLDTFAV